MVQSHTITQYRTHKAKIVKPEFRNNFEVMPTYTGFHFIKIDKKFDQISSFPEKDIRNRSPDN